MACIAAELLTQANVCAGHQQHIAQAARLVCACDMHGLPHILTCLCSVFCGWLLVSVLNHADQHVACVQLHISCFNVCRVGITGSLCLAPTKHVQSHIRRGASATSCSCNRSCSKMELWRHSHLHRVRHVVTIGKF